MPIVSIPLFIKNMGHKILGFILNIEEEDALAVLNGQHDLSVDKAKVLDEFIQICRKLRIQSIDQGDVDFSVFYALPSILLNNKHIFNIWHEQLGGKQHPVVTHDPVVSWASKIALEVFPLFLIKFPPSSHFFMDTFHHLSSLIYRLEERNVLIKMIMADPSLVKLFTNVGKDEIDTHGRYMASSGRGGGLQLAVFPNTIILNAYELMKIRGNISCSALLASVAETIDMLRNLAEGRQIEVPAFVGFHNVGLEDFTELEIEIGKIRAYNDEILSLIPSEARPSTFGNEGKCIGLILEYKYPYQIILGEQRNFSILPPEFEQARKKLNLAQENLSITLALAINRVPAIGISQAWTLVFDPLCHGTNISWSLSALSPMPYYLLKSNEIEAITYWSKIINNSDDGKIRLAIRRILSSINDRMNPIDGFIDSIIAWENLFGGNAELSYRISISIAKLLKENSEERLELQKKVVKYYTERSKIVHGVIEVTHDEAIKNRDECLQIALDSIKKLYEDHQYLLSDAERSKKLALL